MAETTKRVPAEVGVAFLTGRKEVLESLRAQLEDGMSEELAEGILDLAEDLIDMRQALLVEATRLEELAMDLRGQMIGAITQAERIGARVGAFRKGEDPDDAEAKV